MSVKTVRETLEHFCKHKNWICYVDDVSKDGLLFPTQQHFLEHLRTEYLKDRLNGELNVVRVIVDYMVQEASESGSEGSLQGHNSG